MNCRNCGAMCGEGANFCAACGTRVYRYGAPVGQPVTGLMRLHEQRAIAGVCAGLSWYYGWDLALVRIMAVVCAVALFPFAIIAYVAAWLIIPEAPMLVLQPIQQQPMPGQPQT